MKRRSRLNRHSLGPYSRTVALARLDGRRREAIFMRRVREELIAHVGGQPNVVQRALIERAVILSFRVAQIDLKIMQGEVFGLRQNNYAIAWNNALRRTLTALGVEPSPTRASARKSSLNDILHAAE